MAEEVTISTLHEAIAHADEWEAIARKLARDLHFAELTITTLRAELRVYRLGYGIAMDIIKPEPATQQQIEDFHF